MVANPADLERLLQAGVQLQVVPRLSIEESVPRLFSERQTGAVERAKALPVAPTLAPPAVASLYDEIAECIVFGMHGAAITLSGVLVEFVLKYATYIREAGGFANYDPVRWDEFERITFDPAITRAKAAGLLTDQWTDDLQRFKRLVRNPYSHYNIRKITSCVVWRNVKVVNVSTASLEEKTIPAKDDPVLQAQAKPIVDSAQVYTVFAFADAVTKHLLTGIGYGWPAA
jgi:hypothetical protein